LVKVNNWIKNFTTATNGTRQLNKALDLKTSIKTVIKKYDDLKLPKLKQPPLSRPCTSKSTLKQSLSSSSSSEDEDEDEERLKQKRKRQRLLQLAPVINLDEMQFLGSSSLAIQTETGLYHHKEEEVNGNNDAECFSKLTKKPFVGKFEPVKWTCRAPMPTKSSHRLCPRKDRFKCPLHGRIVARDQQGMIVNDSDKSDPSFKNQTPTTTNEPMPWLDADLIADINANSGNNNVLEVVGTKRLHKRKAKSSNLTNLAREGDSPRKRLEKKLFSAKSLSKVGAILDSIEKRHNSQKFHHNFNYSIQS
jgi:hypothetical protein